MKRANKYNNILFILLVLWIIISLAGTFMILHKQKILVGYSSAIINANILFRDSTLYTDYDQYSPEANVIIKGFNFTFNGIVELNIVNLTGDSIPQYPKDISIDNYGYFIDILDTTNILHGNYTIIANDLSYPRRNKNKTIEILAPFLWIGRVINPENETVPANVQVRKSDTDELIANTSSEYSLNFSYGIVYDIYIFPEEMDVIESVVVNWMANEGPLGDSLEIDDTNENASTYVEFDEIIAVYPLLESYKYTTVTVKHSSSERFAVFKCREWKDKERYCPNENWQKIQRIPDGSINTTMVLEPGDPGIGVGEDPCGNGICELVEYGENGSTCWEDCCTDNDNDNYAIEGADCGAVDCNDTDPIINPGATEVCDGIDNDCDGFVDDGFDQDDCEEKCSYTWTGSIGVYACCGDDSFENNPYQTDETICDDNDNDCDGEIDEGCCGVCTAGDTKNCGTDVGACEFGIQTCDLFECWGECEGGIPPAEEQCDGIDNDCDGFVDDGFDQDDCKEKCSHIWTGSTGVYACCGDDNLENNPYQTDETICDGNDNDCDGEIDEGCCGVCTPGDTRNCGTDIGVCAFGIQTCDSFKCWGECEGGIDPVEEVCDGLDNNCDGFIDDGFDQDDCEEKCSYTWTGKTGVYACCGDDSFENNPYQADETICDDNDNDCDGEIDEGCCGICTPGDTRNCGTDIGACAFGTQTCDSLGCWSECEGSVQPTIEICDGIDNDCDGFVDDGFDQDDCKEKCSYTWTGSIGVYACCGDDNLENNPYQIDETVCDGRDNDCDGEIDEGCCWICTPGATRDCGIDVGACEFGTKTCDIHGCWSECEGGILPAIEICDGIDNDCDGFVDDGFDQDDCEEKCSHTWTGSIGVYACCGDDSFENNPYQTDETFCDGNDNDCDGEIDEGCCGICTPGDTRNCGTDIGVCEFGTQTCDSLGCWSECEGGVQPTTEICDGIDNDCDGVIDDGFDQDDCEEKCSHIWTGKTGIYACCGDDNLENNPYQADETFCDSRDNDCDGVVDEGCCGICTPGDTRNCGTDIGVCEFGTQTCDSLGCWSACEGGIWPTEEQCDDKDNDCDSIIDEDMVCCGNGICEPGKGETIGTCPVDCIPPHVPVAPPAPVPPKLTICAEEWNCSDWGSCLPNGTQYRKCWDLNKCEDLYNQKIVTYIERAIKPDEVRACIYVLPVPPVIEKPVIFIPPVTFNYILLIILLIVLLSIAYISYKKSKAREQRKSKISVKIKKRKHKTRKRKS